MKLVVLFCFSLLTFPVIAELDSPQSQDESRYSGNQNLSQASLAENVKQSSKQSSILLGDGISAGIGLGLPYGILGFQLNVPVSHSFSAFTALGNAFVVTWQLGAIYRPISYFPRFRLLAMYGTNTIVSTGLFGLEYRGYQGFSAGLGFAPDIGRSGWTFDLLSILSSNVDQDKRYDEDDFDKESPSDIKISLGYLWAF